MLQYFTIKGFLPSFSQSIAPTKIPIHLFVLRALCVCLKVGSPLMLDALYTNYALKLLCVWLLLGTILMFAMLHLGQIVSNMALRMHNLRLKSSLVRRLASCMSTQNGALWTNISSQLPVFINNYCSSYLSLVFDVLTILGLLWFLANRLTYALIVGLFIAACVMRKILQVTEQIMHLNFQNMEVKKRKEKLLQYFFNKEEAIKMCWLDLWFKNKLSSLQQMLIDNIGSKKMLDCWCVVLWRVTPVLGTVAIFLLCPDPAITPAALLYSFQLLTTPLNAISWYVGGLRSAKQALERLKPFLNASATLSSFSIRNHILHLQSNYSLMFYPRNIYSLRNLSNPHSLTNQLLGQGIGLVEEDAWMLPTFMQTVTFSNNNKQHREQSDNIRSLLRVFCCEELHLNNSPTTYSGGEKIRVSLIRAFLLTDVIVIKSNLTSLNSSMKLAVEMGIRQLVAGKIPGFEHRNYIVIAHDCTRISHQSLIQNNPKITFIPNQPLLQQIDIPIVSEQTRMNLQKQFESMILSAPKQKTRLIQREQVSAVVNRETYKFYFASKQHILFLLGILGSTGLAKWYEYETSASQGGVNVWLMGLLGAGIWVAMGFRAYWFARAHLIDGTRIVTRLSDQVIMSQLNQTPNSATDSSWLLLEDTTAIIDDFPFQANILANNVVMVAACIFVVACEVPFLTPFFAFFLYKALQQYLTRSRTCQALTHLLHIQEIQLLQCVEQLSLGAKDLTRYGQKDRFLNKLNESLLQCLKQEWEIGWVQTRANLVHRAMTTVLFSIAIVQFVGWGGASAGFAFLVQHVQTLADYILHLGGSLWATHLKSFALQRARSRLLQPPSRRTQLASHIINKEATGNATLVLEGLNFSYGQESVLRDLHLQIRQGQTIVLRGRSGVGKTTLFKILTSCYLPQLQLSAKPFPIAFSPQHPLILPQTLTVKDNIDPYHRFPEAAELFASLESQIKIDASVQTLTTDQQLKINNFRAFLQGRKGIILYDEPHTIYHSHKTNTRIIVTHHGSFHKDKQYQFVQGKLKSLA